MKLVIGLCRGLVWFVWSLLRFCPDGCYVDEAFRGNCLLDRISADIQGCIVVVYKIHWVFWEVFLVLFDLIYAA